ncbi:hypothetical protein [Crateriforma conspicua]|uniref:hypothetical protein n=1 Tax=Crateriforma conspicua TaxID=2527996 RepID=UPI0011885DCF|nr:hypothetical protein [Crateriforma conspicua]QDV61092.1 hypothetical protein Mal65_02150 [Crateriforma conspicua]
MDEPPTFRGEIAFTYRSLRSHLREYLSRPFPIIACAVAVFGVLWTIGEATIQFTDANPRGVSSYLLLVGASIVASLAWTIYEYVHHVPDGFENVFPAAQRIAHLQRPLWEFRLAKSLLAQRLAPYERELRDMESGRYFVIAEKPESLQAYIRWAGARNENLFSMLDVAKELILNDFPASLQSTDTESADPKRILDAVERLGRFYGETVAFERASRAVMPSDDFKELHQLQFGWSDSIRDGVRQLFQFLQRMCECDPHGDNHIKFEIVFDEPDNVSRYCDELDRLGSNVHALEQNW